MNKILLTVLGTSAVVFALLCAGCATQPRDEGQIGKVTLNKAVYSGVTDTMVIMVSDVDLVSAPSVTVTSDDDKTGITVQLVTASTGVFKKTIHFTTGKSGTGDSIQVSNNSNVTITYKDAKPAGTRVEKAVWKDLGHMGIVSLDKTTYSGTKDGMIITVSDSDLVDPPSVTVISDDDQVGITAQLNKDPDGKFRKTITFSTGKSGTGDTLQVSNNSVVTVTYKDVDPWGARVAKSVWKSVDGVVSFDAASYSSVIKPMKITVNDADVSDASVLVTVTTTSSSATNLVTLKSTGVYGAFSGSIVFSTKVANAETLLVKDKDTILVTYADAVPNKSFTARAAWNGVAGVVTLDKAKYVAFAAPMAITLVDSDLTLPSINVNVKSATDTAGITLMLKPVAGKIGTYGGSVTFTLNASVEQKSIQVSDNDVVTVTYNDAAPMNTIKQTAVWNGIAGTVSLDSAAYKGQSKMTITVDDADVLDSTVSVKVKSIKDTTGITVKLKADSTGKFTGKVGFSLGASTATTIAAKDSDTVSVIYNDMVPKTTVTKIAVYYLGLVPAFGIFSGGATPGTSVDSTLIPKLFVWGGTGFYTVDSAANYAGTGNAVRITTIAGQGWAGFGWAQVNAGGTLASINMTAFAACSLHVRLKGNATDIKILVENLTHTGQTFLATSTYGYSGDEQWHEIAIPLSAWSGTCDLSNVDYFMGATFDPFTAGQYIIIDDLYWTLPKK
jgi:hypothetical protein